MTIIIARTLFYLLTLLIPLAEPAILVSYDPMGIWLYAVLIPIAMFLGMLEGKRTFLLLMFLTLSSVVLFPRVSREGAGYIFLALYAYGSTRLYRGRRIFILLMIEPFLMGLIHYRLLLFTLSSQDIAVKQQPFGAALFVILILSFLTYSALLFQGASGAVRLKVRESLILGGGAALIVLFALFISTEGAIHKMVPENLNDPLVNDFEMMDLTTNNPFGEGNLRGNSDPDNTDGQQPGDGTQPGDQPGDQTGRLLGVPGSAWDQAQQGEGDGEGQAPRQYAVMVVESPRDATYLADRYYDIHDRQLGFTPDGENYLNHTARDRYLETWKNTHLPLLAGREAVHVSVISVEAAKSVPYFPYSIEPTVNNTVYYPFVYSWKSLSLIFNDRWSSLSLVRDDPDAMTDEARAALGLDLADEDLVRLDSLLERASLEGLRPYSRVQAILQLYGSYQYNVGFTENWDTDYILDFLTVIREGDCTEFSNGAALLLRRAGLPARVVTGYLASEGMQTPNHKRGLLMLQQQIPPLAEKNPDDLYLVTTAHRHAWVQVWFPRFGWVDFETTGNAIAPQASGDANNRDVVIPVITETVQGDRPFVFPWRVLLRLSAWTGALLILAVYMFKIVYSAYLSSQSRRSGEIGLKAAYRLLLLRWAGRGHPVRTPQMTPAEYARLCPELTEATFAFTNALYNTAATALARDEAAGEFRRAVRQALRGDRSFIRGIRELIAVKGVIYALRSR